jgi:hypothetical protein
MIAKGRDTMKNRPSVLVRVLMGIVLLLMVCELLYGSVVRNASQSVAGHILAGALAVAIMVASATAFVSYMSSRAVQKDTCTPTKVLESRSGRSPLYFVRIGVGIIVLTIVVFIGAGYLQQFYGFITPNLIADIVAPAIMFGLFFLVYAIYI